MRIFGEGRSVLPEGDRLGQVRHRGKSPVRGPLRSERAKEEKRGGWYPGNSGHLQTHYGGVYKYRNPGLRQVLWSISRKWTLI